MLVAPTCFAPDTGAAAALDTLEDVEALGCAAALGAVAGLAAPLALVGAAVTEVRGWGMLAPARPALESLGCCCCCWDRGFAEGPVATEGFGVEVGAAVGRGTWCPAPFAGTTGLAGAW